MKQKIIEVIKKNGFLYNNVKKVAKYIAKCKRDKTINNEINNYLYFGYVMQKRSDLLKIKNHFNNINFILKRMIIFIDNEDLDLELHNFFEENPNIIFVSINYMLENNVKANITNLFMVNFDLPKINYEKVLNIVC